MKQLAIIWHSRTGAARAMAQAAADAAEGADGVMVTLVAADDAEPALLLSCDGYIFCCPENLAAISGAMKEMFDRCYYPLLGQIQGRPYAIMVAAGSDGSNAVRQIARIATGWRLKPVAEPIIINTLAQTPEAIRAAKRLSSEALADCAELGATMATGLAFGVF